MYPERTWKEILTIISGKNQKEVENPNGKYPIYGSGGIIGYANESLCPAHTVIIGRKGTIDKPIFVTEPFWNIDTAFGIVAGKEVLPKFLYFFCRIFNFKSLDKSTGRPSLAKTDLLKIKMPLPDLEEQARIVARIEELFSQLENGVETLKQTKEQLAVYRQAVLKEAFDSIVNGTPTSLSECIIEKPRNGYSPKAVDFPTKYKNLTLTATTSGKFIEDCYKYIDIDIDDNSYLWVRHNDILIQRANTLEYVGTAVVYTGEDYKYVYPDLMMKCTTKANINPFFIVYQLQLQRTRQYYRKNATGTAGSMPKINQSVVMNTPVIITDLNEQNVIVSQIESRLSVCDQIEQTVDAALQQAEALRQSILKKAFEGGL